MTKGQRIRVTDAYPIDGAAHGVNYWIRGRTGVILGVSEPLTPDGEPLVSVRIEAPRSRIEAALPGAIHPAFLAFLYPSEMEIIA